MFWKLFDTIYKLIPSNHCVQRTTFCSLGEKERGVLLFGRSWPGSTVLKRGRVIGGKNLAKVDGSWDGCAALLKCTCDSSQCRRNAKARSAAIAQWIRSIIFIQNLKVDAYMTWNFIAIMIKVLFKILFCIASSFYDWKLLDMCYGFPKHEKYFTSVVILYFCIGKWINSS